MKRKKTNIMVTFLMICMVLLSTSTTAFASNKSTITPEEYYKAVEEEYAKFHIDFKVENYNPEFEYTQELLQKQLEDIRIQMSSVTNYDEEEGVFIENELLESNVSTNDSKRIMPTTQIFTKNFKINSPLIISGIRMGWADIEQKITTTVDVQSNYFMSIDGCTTRQSGSALNFWSWNQNSSTTEITNGGRSAWCMSYGTLTIRYTDPFLGGTYTYSSDHKLGGSCNL